MVQAWNARRQATATTTATTWTGATWIGISWTARTLERRRLDRHKLARRPRLHGLIQRIPGTHRYQVTDTGLQHALFLTRVHDRLIRTGTAQLTDTDPPTPTQLRAAAHTYRNALDHLSRQAGLVA